ELPRLSVVGSLRRGLGNEQHAYACSSTPMRGVLRCFLCFSLWQRWPGCELSDNPRIGVRFYAYAWP
ncbi:hypothetical protein PIB30_089670, partial [Stylosanthes scabra]|nr:hypothetical protein [Stylosanthes scabra]